jgi:hypothetical protein
MALLPYRFIALSLYRFIASLFPVCRSASDCLTRIDLPENGMAVQVEVGTCDADNNKIDLSLYFLTCL